MMKMDMTRRSPKRFLAAGSLAGAAALAVLVIAPAVTQAVPTTTCNNQTIVANVVGNLNVPNGAGPCHVAGGVSISGNITVGTKTSLFFDAPGGQSVGGSVSVNS